MGQSSQTYHPYSRKQTDMLPTTTVQYPWHVKVSNTWNMWYAIASGNTWTLTTFCHRYSMDFAVVTHAGLSSSSHCMIWFWCLCLTINSKWMSQYLILVRPSTLPHDKLLDKLRYYGIHGNIHSWITNFLKHRQQCVVIDGVSSEYVHVESGVSQGTVMGPLLYIRLVLGMSLLKFGYSQMTVFSTDPSDVNRITSHSRRTWTVSAHGRTPGVWVLTPPSTTSWTSPPRRTHQYTSTLWWYVYCLKWRLRPILVSQWLATSKGSQIYLVLLPKLIGPCTVSWEAALVSYDNLHTSVSWDPSWSMHQPCFKDITQLQSVQRGGAHFVMKDHRRRSSVTTKLGTLEWDSLQERRKNYRISIMKKIVSGRVAINSDDYLRTRSVNSDKFKHNSTKTEVFKNSYFPRTIPQWNNPGGGGGGGTQYVKVYA